MARHLGRENPRLTFRSRLVTADLLTRLNSDFDPGTTAAWNLQQEESAWWRAAG